MDPHDLSQALPAEDWGPALARSSVEVVETPGLGDHYLREGLVLLEGREEVIVLAVVDVAAKLDIRTLPKHLQSA